MIQIWCICNDCLKYTWFSLDIISLYRICVGSSFVCEIQREASHKDSILQWLFYIVFTDWLEKEISFSMTAERRSNSEHQRHSSCVDHYAKLFRISLMVKHVLDLVKAQTFWTAEASTGFNEKFVSKSIGSPHVKKPFGAKIFHPNFLYPFGLEGLEME